MAAWRDRLVQLFAAHQSRLEAFVSRRTGDPQIAADLAQEAFVRLARLPESQKIDNAPGYLFTIAGNLARDHNRRAQRWQRLDGGVADERHPAPEPDAEEQTAKKEQSERLRQVIATLPEPGRSAFLLFHLEGLSYKEIARRLDLTDRHVEYQLTRALALCRQEMRREIEEAADGQRRGKK